MLLSRLPRALGRMGKQGGKRSRFEGGVRHVHGVAAMAAAPPYDGAGAGDAKRMKPATAPAAGRPNFTSRSGVEAATHQPPAAAPAPVPKPAHAAAKPRLAAIAGAPLFESLEVAAELKLAISDDLGFASMTPVQAATLPLILQGKDLLAKAKTGTGKTLAFLVPTLHRLLTHPRTHADAGPDGPIRALVLSPTRELAAQTQTEAIALLGRAGGRVRSALVVGGNKPGGDAARMRGPLDLLVATPGRLKDHCENTAGFSARLKGCETLILDEGDQLLAAGFMPDIQRILAHLTSPRRQSLCFSATIPPDLAKVLGVALRKDHASVDCVGADAPDTHAKVPQSWALVEAADQLATVMRLVREEQASDPLAKIIIFFTTARQTQFGAEASPRPSGTPPPPPSAAQRPP
jgi:superfamily II DNA/RNA helicase